MTIGSFLTAIFVSNVLARCPVCVVGDAARPENRMPGPLAHARPHRMAPDPKTALGVLIAPRRGRLGCRSDRARPLRRPAVGL
jgi:hypothetical protein